MKMLPVKLAFQIGLVSCLKVGLGVMATRDRTQDQTQDTHDCDACFSQSIGNSGP